MHSYVDENSDQIGELLRQAREDAGLVIDDVVFKTRIPRVVVSALEMGDFTVFASPMYARSFLAQYSGFLNVDADPWLDAIESDSYRLDDAGLHVLDSYRPEPILKSPERSSMNGWFAGISTVAVSCGLVVIAIKGYDLLERRFGGELRPVSDTSAPQSAPPEVLTDAAKAKPEKNPQDPGLDDFVEPPMRATIVRDTP
jgi:cytoskeletal protein RodZ